MLTQKQELILMSLISSPKSGVEIRDSIYDAVGVNYLPASLYPTLKQMEEKAMIRPLDAQASKRSIMYEISEWGEELLARQNSRKEYLSSF